MLGILAHGQPAQCIIPKHGSVGIRGTLRHNLVQTIIAVGSGEYMRHGNCRACGLCGFYRCAVGEIWPYSCGWHNLHQVANHVVIMKRVVIFFVLITQLVA